MGWRFLRGLAGVILAIFLTSPAWSEELLVIVNPSVEINRLSPAEISSIYLLKTLVWPDGTRVVPVNREATSDSRARFTTQVLKQDNAELAAYWSEMHFKGHLPPVIQESDQAVIAFVQNIPGAIGYVLATAPPANVKVVARLP